MGITRGAELLSAASYLTNAADNLRALGLVALAEQIEAFVATLNVEILLTSVGDD
jgi:hypothetical protein